MSQYFGAHSGLDELQPQRASILLHDGESRQFDLGGRVVQVSQLGFAQTDGDLFVYVPKGKVLFTGNPIISGGPSIPWLLDGHSVEALATLRKVRRTFPSDAIVVPGHGTPTDMKAIDRHIAYLEELQKDVGAAVAAGLDAKQTSAKVSEQMQGQYGAYKIYPWVHSQLNVAKVYEEQTHRH